VEVFAREFARTGFRGALNWYRNIDRMWELTRFLSGAQVRQPAVFIAGELDAVLLLYAEVLQSLESSMPRLRDKVLLPGAGHWVQQERPAEVNLHLLQFLAEL
ncbi:MAG: alpha/beta fold hydrolase, partial [Candidatus Binatia bacterium]